MNNYTSSRFGRYGAGNGVTAVPMSSSGVTVTAGISGGTGGDGTIPTAATILTAIGFLVVFYWATRQIQGSR